MMLIHRDKELLIRILCDVEISNDCFGNLCESRPLGSNMIKFLVMINDRDDQLNKENFHPRSIVSTPQIMSFYV